MGFLSVLLVALISVEIYAYTTKRGWTIKMPDGVPPAVTKSFCCADSKCTSHALIFFCHQYIIWYDPLLVPSMILFFNVLQMPLKGAGNTLTAQIFYSLACTIFWFFWD